MRDGLKGTPGLHLQRVENVVATGVPDVEGCYVGESFWCELKGCDRPAKRTTPIRYKLTLEQVEWLEKRWRAGGNCFLYIRVGVGHDIRRYLLRGDRAREALTAHPEDWWDMNSLIPPRHKPREWLDMVTKKGPY